MRRHFETSQWLPYPAEIVFAFFANPANLPPLLPAWQRARLDEIELKPAAAPMRRMPRLRIAAGNGTRMKLSFRVLPLSPLRMSWTVRIENFRWNEHFEDVQVRGPFRYWRQQHMVRPSPAPNGSAPGTVLEDRIEYELPLHPLSTAAVPFVKLQLAALFRFRHKRTAELLPRFAAHITAGAGHPS